MKSWDSDSFIGMCKGEELLMAEVRNHFKFRLKRLNEIVNFDMQS